VSAGDDSAARARRRERTDARESTTILVGYEDQTGETQAVTGDDDGPQVNALVRSSSDGVTGLVSEADGVNNRIAADSLGRLWIAGTAGALAVNRYSSAAEEAQHTIATVATRIYAARMLIAPGTAADTWLMFFDTAAAVANGASPIWRALMPNPGAGAGEVSETFDTATLKTTTGLVVAVSTTRVTLTLPGNIALFELLTAPV